MRKIKIYIALNVLIPFFAINLSYGQGARYTGTYTKSSAIEYRDKSNFVIEGLEITNSDRYLIVLYNCENVIIRNNRLASAPTRLAIYLDNCKNVTVIDNTFEMSSPD